MDKAVLRNFAIESRKDLMEKIDRKIKLFYVDEEFKKDNRGDVIVLSNDKHSLTLTKEEDSNRDKLLNRIVELGYVQVVEEAAYTWFNRIIAIRYMEINDYLPLTSNNQSLNIRVLSSRDGSASPEILKFSNLTRNDLDLNFNKEFFSTLNNEESKFKYILLLVCKKLGKVIPQVFDGVTDYIDLLIPDNMLSDTGFVRKLINTIDESNFSQVEIIGWLYQYYNQTEKDRAMSSSKAYKKNEIPYVTQLFTPDWIVKYLVENSLVKYYFEHNGIDEELKKDFKYYIDTNLERKHSSFSIENLKFIDPCCGSGHILVYAFEVLYKLYVNEGYSKNDISEKILCNNLFGLDIDDRAGQLSILSVLLKAREYDKNIFNKEISKNLNVLSIQESNNISDYLIDEITGEENKSKAHILLDNYYNAKEYGSLIKPVIEDLNSLYDNINSNVTIFGIELRNKLLPLMKLNDIFKNKYNIVVTNPPYMGANKMSDTLKSYLKENYNDSKTDLCTAFMEIQMVDEDGYLAMINQQAWMFLGSFENLRKKIINNKSIYSMLHMGMGTFGADFGTTAFVLGKKTSESGHFFRLGEYKTSEEKEKGFLKNLIDKNNYYRANNERFTRIIGYPIAYWASDKIVSAFENRLLSDIADTKQGLATGDNDKYLRYWFEVSYDNIGYNCRNSSEAKDCECKWFPCNKGGEFRKWFGNNYRVVDWYNDGENLKKFKGSVLRNVDYYFKEGLTWSSMTSSDLSMRYSEQGNIFESKGSMCYLKDNNNLYYVLGLLNSKVINNLLLILSPTLDYHEGPMGRVPVIISDEYFNKVEEIVKENIEIAKRNWNNNEYSHEYENSLITFRNMTISDAIKEIINKEQQEFNLLKSNEEELNRIFIKIYGLENELLPDLNNDEISYSIEKPLDIIKKLISFSVGCMFGRYSLDDKGIVYAGGKFDVNNYKTFIPDNDNIIPISDNENVYYNDDIVGKFKDFIRVVFGKENLDININYIADILGKKGTESNEETIRRYFVNDFYNDHIKTYQKRPIYWLFDSGKKNGFKCLIYLHRYDEQIVSKIRTKYLHNTLSIYQKTVEEIDYKLSNEALSTTDKRNLQNRKSDLNGKITECNEYDEMVGNVANKMIKLELDDGVSVNHSKFVDDNGKSILANIK